MEQVLTIEILGQPFSFKTDVDVADAREVAAYVAQSIDQAKAQCSGGTSNPDKRAILVLTALNITNEYFELKRKHQQLLQTINQRSENLLHALESRTA